MSVIIDKNADFSVFEQLDKMNIKYIKSFDLKNLYSPVNTHPDMQIFFAEKNLAFVAPAAFEHYKSLLPKSITLIKGEKDPDEKYPKDCAYNLAVVGKNLVGNLKFAEKKIIEYFSEKNFDFINVKQGYTKCNLCIVGENAVVTEDENIYKVLNQKNIKVLKIKSGEISLKGFDYGFIGGASGFVDKNKIAFFGDFSKTSYYNELKGFVEAEGKEFLTLSKIPPNDYGSILFF